MKRTAKLSDAESAGTLILDTVTLTIRGFQIPSQSAESLNKRASKDLLDADDLYAITERHRDSETSIWGGSTGEVVDVRWKGKTVKLATPPDKARYKPVEFHPRGTELLIVDNDFASYRTQLLSPFKRSKLKIDYEFHSLGETLKWMSPKVSYGEEIFDEYRWADGSEPEFIWRNTDTGFYLARSLPSGLAVSQLL